MFENIGGKIKALAKVTCIVGIVASALGAIGLWMANSSNNPTMLTGFVILAVGCLCSWIGSFFCYGFGKMVENSDKQTQYLQELANNGIVSELPAERRIAKPAAHARPEQPEEPLKAGDIVLTAVIVIVLSFIVWVLTT